MLYEMLCLIILDAGTYQIISSLTTQYGVQNRSNGKNMVR